MKEITILEIEALSKLVTEEDSANTHEYIYQDNWLIDEEMLETEVNTDHGETTLVEVVIIIEETERWQRCEG